VSGVGWGEEGGDGGVGRGKRLWWPTREYKSYGGELIVCRIL
jgi:hypothetical protein